MFVIDNFLILVSFLHESLCEQVTHGQIARTVQPSGNASFSGDVTEGACNRSHPPLEPGGITICKSQPYFKF